MTEHTDTNERFDIPEVTHESVAIQYGKDAAANAFTLGRNKGIGEGEQATVVRIAEWLDYQHDNPPDHLRDGRGVVLSEDDLFAIRQSAYISIADAIRRGDWKDDAS